MSTEDEVHSESLSQNLLSTEGVATEAKMTAESRTLEPESPVALRYFEARINRISYTIGGS